MWVVLCVVESVFFDSCDSGSDAEDRLLNLHFPPVYNRSCAISKKDHFGASFRLWRRLPLSKEEKWWHIRKAQASRVAACDVQGRVLHSAFEPVQCCCTVGHITACYSWHDSDILLTLRRLGTKSDHEKKLASSMVPSPLEHVWCFPLLHIHFPVVLNQNCEVARWDNFSNGKKTTKGKYGEWEFDAWKNGLRCLRGGSEVHRVKTTGQSRNNRHLSWARFAFGGSLPFFFERLWPSCELSG